MYVHHQLWPPAAIEWSVKQTETIIHRAKPVAPFRMDTWGTGWLESRPQRESLSGLQPPSGHPTALLGESRASSFVPPWQRN